jgi:hypothetical protein
VLATRAGACAHPCRPGLATPPRSATRCWPACCCPLFGLAAAIALMMSLDVATIA